MDEWEIPPLVSKSNKVHKRFCLLLIFMAFVGGALIEIADNSTPDECEEGGALVSIGVFLYWISFLSVAINGLILLVSIFIKEMSTGEVYLQALFHIIMLIVVLAIFGEAINCHFPISVAPSYDIGAGFWTVKFLLCDRADDIVCTQRMILYIERSHSWKPAIALFLEKSTIKAVFWSNDVHSKGCKKYNTCSKNSKLLQLFRTVQESNVGLRFRVGALFFIILSIPIFSIFVMGWYVYINLFLIVLIFIATTYLLGGTTAFFRNQRKGMFAIFAVNLISFVLLLVFYLTYLYGYLTDPCYIEPMRCDDQLTDSPAELKAIGVWTGILALLTYMSWRLQRGHSVETDNEE